MALQGSAEAKMQPSPSDYDDGDEKHKVILSLDRWVHVQEGVMILTDLTSTGLREQV